MLSRFFIERPIFAWVIAIGIMMAGLGAMLTLPIAQYPDIAPPSVNISANYPGAAAETVETSVTQVIEQQLTGIDGLMYFSSSSTANGQARITVTFKKGTDPDTAQVQVQNKVQQALSRLPNAVQQQGLTVTKSQTDFLMVVGLYDRTDTASQADIADYLVNNFQDAIARVDGVGSSQIFGSQYAMRIWLDPYRLATVKLMPSDVQSAIAAQNVEVSAGQIGADPAPEGQQLNATVTARARLQTPEQFRNIIVKTQSDGSVVHLSDVARVELGNESYTSSARLSGHPASGMALQLAPGADALKTAELVKAKVRELSTNLPHGYTVTYPRDTTPFIKLSVEEVVQTLIEAVALVVVVMFIFLQSWRATLVPAIAVPVVLLGTFGVLALFGYSINTLTLFGMVLAIGLLVDDAIVVVENVERIMEEEGLSPRQATIKSMEEIGSALIGIALVLSAVLLPMAFFGGSTGVIYRQFSITIVSSMLLSVVVALILSPALCATILKPVSHEKRDRGWTGKFNRWFGRVTHGYMARLNGFIGRRTVFWIGYAVMLGLLWLLFVRLPTSFLPVEDQGQVMVQVTLPAGAKSSRTSAAIDQIQNYFVNDEKDNVDFIFVTQGFSFAGQGENTAQGFVSLVPWDKRKGAANSATMIANRATKQLAAIRDAKALAMTPPSIRGLGQSNGFTFELLNTGGLSRERFLELRNQLMKAATGSPKLAGVRAATLEDTPQLKVDIDSEKLAVLGLTQSSVDNVLSAAWGSTYINDFVDRGRVKRVYMQADAPFRALPTDLDNWQVRSATTGEMVPFSAFATTHWTMGPTTVSRYNGQSSYEIQGQAAPGSSSGEAMDEMVKLQKQLPPGTGYAWSGLSYQEQLSGGQAPLLYGLSVLVVFLCLAALYESWSIPLAVLLVIPLGLIGAVLAVTLRGLENNIYFQVGLLTTMGLAAKNAILIVEFAELAYLQGKDAMSAALEAARLRFRPILMTSLAFIAGVIPLAIASGAGAQSRVAIGTAVIGGMLTATVLAIFYVPLFFLTIMRIFNRKNPPSPAANATEVPA
ncbi:MULTISPECIES: efflux RND transporter permease subunit [Sphingobium]|uniref:Efflux pump membrane transporter n=1 Tax=Sphingobium fuliginis (strain ATCC 27551) TaxID=336203 RepID=A0ABQ1EWK9_SPHSA|nr:MULTISPECIES: efflux RND transporter permease subunit [Sphingobium]AJR23481.1 multidrug transporter [Sphingobium sp. YBL2]MCB4861456.1 multidrug efflux RND transporter permease subunit [Sphingobium sp. PNB]PNP96271.1 aminoglycoside/multidrug transporter permease [Sphingobium sp. SA916]RYL98253.1 multidrug efflux RND transporter permease subunit [Sphingobium fuliginis]UXC93467.1 efflux RND transporter permease subunit [Sphingobium sp. RSMS]